MGTAEAPFEDHEPPGAGIDFTNPHSRLAPLYFQWSHLAVATVLVLVFLLLCLQPLWYTDVWGHLKFGEYLVTNGRLPEVEPFADLADKQTPFVSFYTLTQCAYYVTFRFGEWLAGGDSIRRTAGGVEMLHILHAACIVIRSLFLLLAMRRLDATMAWAGAGTVLTLILGVANVGVMRPQVVGETLFALLLWLLCHGRPRWPNTAAILATLVTWANCHGSFLVGLFVLASFALGLAIQRPTRGLGLRHAWTFLLAATLCGLLNPHGPWLYLHVLELARHPNVADMDEWKRLDWTSPWGVAFASSLVLLGLTAAAVVVARRRAASETHAITDEPLQLPRLLPTQTLLLLVIGAQTCLHQRMMPWWVMLVPWVVAPHCSWSMARLGWKGWSSTPSLRTTIIAVLILWAIAMWTPAMDWLRTGDPRSLERSLHPATAWRVAEEIARPTGEHFPALTEWVQRTFSEGRYRGRVYATETVGDYLLWALPSEVPIFTYTHVHLYSPAAWKESLRVKNALPDWQDILDRRGVNLIVMEGAITPGLRAAILASPNQWEILLDESDDQSKRDPKGRLLVAVRRKPL